MDVEDRRKQVAFERSRELELDSQAVVAIDRRVVRLACLGTCAP